MFIGCIVCFWLLSVDYSVYWFYDGFYAYHRLVTGFIGCVVFVIYIGCILMFIGCRVQWPLSFCRESASCVVLVGRKCPLCVSRYITHGY